MSNYCACSGGDEEYTIELNQQGPEGPQGPVGPEGFSPSISVKTNTDKAYILTVVNKEGNFDTPNLYGELEKLNADLSNLPNPAYINGVILSRNEEGVPSIQLDTSKATVNTYGNLVFSTSATNEGATETFNYELVVNPTDQRLELHDNEGNVKIVATTDEIAIVQSQLSDKLDKATYEADKATYATKEELASTDATVASIQTELGNKLESSNIIAGANITIDRNGNDLTINSTGGGGGSGDVTAAGNNRFTGDNTFTGKVNIAGGALTVDGLATLNQATAQYLNAVSITSSGEINATSIKANGLRSDDIQTTENKKYLTEVDVDNQTIQIVNGKLHANIDELGNEVNDLSNRVTTLQTSKQDTLTAGANITIVDNVISAIGGSGGVSIDDSTTSTASTWSSSKISSEITSVAETKNDNIFDIGKFKVVGSPTITDDGIASGFSSGNYINVLTNIDNTASKVSTVMDITIGDVSNLSHSVFFGFTLTNHPLKIGSNYKVWFYSPGWASGKTIYSIGDMVSVKYEYDITTKRATIFSKLKSATDWIEEGYYTADSNPIGGTLYLGRNVSATGEYHTGSIDLKNFSITVDGEQVFNGLMESTKPIYDKLSSTSTALSTFQTDTDNNFSAVNSALNEKANLSDLASKQNVLTAGANITIEGNVISATGGGSGSGDVTAAGNNTFTGTNTFNKKIIIPLNTSDHENGIEMTSSLFLGNPNDNKLNPVWIARQTQKGSQLGRFFLAVNGRVGIEVQDGAAPSSATSRALFQLDDTGIYYRQGAGEAINIWELITTMNNTISSLTDRISALETEINGGNA